MSTEQRTPEDLCIGQVWREMDERLERFVLIVELEDQYAWIQRCTYVGEVIDPSRYRKTKAKRERFNGRRGGYAKVRDYAGQWL